MYCTVSFHFQDPQTVLREKCRAKADCSRLAARLDECNERVRSRVKTSENCHEEVIDLFHCVDECVSSAILFLFSSIFW